MLKFITAFMIIVGIAGYAVQSEPPSISYAVNISKGETLWDVCDRVSGGRKFKIIKNPRGHWIVQSGDRKERVIIEWQS